MIANNEQDEQSSANTFVGRQPIFDRDQNVFGYELLFRSGSTTNANLAGQGDMVSLSLMNNSLTVIGLEALTGGKKAFVNITRKLLLDGDYTVLPKDVVVIELLENITPDDEVLDACKKLKDAGYTLALDDMVSEKGYESLLGLVDIVKVDFRGVAPQERIALAQRLAGLDVKLLAEKVETREEYAEAVEANHDLFQGYFFSKPQIIEGQELSGLKQNYLRLMAEVNRLDINFDQLEQVIRSDVSLSAKLLRYLNSASFGVKNRIDSVKHALVLLGVKPLKKWVTLITMSHIGKDAPDELMVNSLIRARFCELIAQHTGLAERQFDVFMMGMMSVLDVMLGQPIEEVMASLPLPPDVKATLAGEETPLSNLYAFSLACERVNRSRAVELAQSLGVPESQADQVYFDAIVWADQVVRG